jgi:peroxiredoxin
MSLFHELFGGKPSMPTLSAGKHAPDFSLTTLEGAPFHLADALAKGPVVLAFFKISCPTCQYAFPFLERLFHAYKDKGVTLVGVSQNDAKDTKAFVREFGVSFPMLLDDLKSYPVSNAYGLANVPTVFWIAQDGEIEIASIGWVKTEFEALNHKFAESSKVPVATVFKPGDEVRDYRAG